MNIDRIREELPHYIVSPSNEYERQLLASIYAFHQASPIRIEEKPHEDRTGLLTKVNKRIGQASVIC